MKNLQHIYHQMKTDQNSVLEAFEKLTAYPKSHSESKQSAIGNKFASSSHSLAQRRTKACLDTKMMLSQVRSGQPLGYYMAHGVDYGMLQEAECSRTSKYVVCGTFSLEFG
jgi:hypothetical protein